MNINRLFIAVLLGMLVMFFLSGCATKNKEMYYWGEYENLILDAYTKPGSSDALTQIEKLSTGLQKAENIGKKIPPGIYAHLGFLYATQGQNSKSKDAFMEEKKLFPESIIFIDGMLERAKKNENHN